MYAKSRRFAIALSSMAVSLLALASVPQASASGTVTLLPTAGSGSEVFSVVTPTGCGSPNATHYVIRLSGGGLTAPINLSGVQPLSAIPALADQTTPMTISVPLTLDVALGRGVTLPGVFDISVVCRGALVPTPVTTFTGKITVFEGAKGITFAEGTQPTSVTNSVKPKITGQAKVGGTLTVSTGTWSPATATTKVTWKVGGKQVGTGVTYKVKSADKGKTVVAEVEATSEGLTPGKASASVKIK